MGFFAYFQPVIAIAPRHVIMIKDISRCSLSIGGIFMALSGMSCHDFGTAAGTGLLTQRLGIFAEFSGKLSASATGGHVSCGCTSSSIILLVLSVRDMISRAREEGHRLGFLDPRDRGNRVESDWTRACPTISFPNEY